MKKLQNTLYVTTQGSYLAKEGEAVVVRVDKETRLRVPVHAIEGIVCFGQVGLSPYLMGFCAERGVTISFLTDHGRFLARVHGPVSGNVLLRREQYRRADDSGESAEIARAAVLGKIANCRQVLLRAQRDHSEKHEGKTITRNAGRLAQYARKLATPQPLNEIRGIEGEASKSYFGSFDALITAQKQGFAFRGRNRRPPTDNVNCLLSFVYTLLVHDCRSALEGVGLDPQVGFLHRDRPGRPSLALDMMEEFRAPFADRLVLSLINRQQVQAKDFQKSQGGGVTMKDGARKDLLIAYQKRKQDELVHPFLGEKVKVGLLFHVQALLLSRFLRGDINGYPPFLWK